MYFLLKKVMYETTGNAESCFPGTPVKKSFRIKISENGIERIKKTIIVFYIFGMAYTQEYVVVYRLNNLNCKNKK